MKPQDIIMHLRELYGQEARIERYRIASTLLDKYTLTGSNYIDWLRNVRIVLRTESLLHVLEDPVPDEHPINAPQEQIDAFNKYMS